MNLAQLKLFRSAARVQRMHVVTTHHRQTVGEHTFGALCLLFFIDPDPSMNVVRALLRHDMAEAIGGDVPAPTKYRYPALGAAFETMEEGILRSHGLDDELVEYERRLLGYCDLMELAMYACEEVDIGNVTMATVLRNALAALRDKHLTDITPIANELYNFIATRTDLRYGTELGTDRLCGWTG